MPKHIFEQWLKQIGTHAGGGFLAGAASILNLSGELPDPPFPVFYQDPADDRERISEDWSTVMQDFAIAVKRELNRSEPR